jgi:uncharacterized membrane protein
MNLLIIIVFFVLMVMTGVAMYSVPLLSRSGTFFGTTVSSEFRTSDDARRIVSRYRQSVIFTTAAEIVATVVIALYLQIKVFAIVVISAAVIQYAVGIAALVDANRRTRPFARPKPSSSRSASLVPQRRTLPGGTLLLVGPLFIMVSVGLMVVSRRTLLLAETYKAAMAGVIVGTLSSGLLVAVAWIGVFRTRQGSANGSAGTQSESRKLGYFILVFLAYGFALQNAALSLLTSNIVTNPTARRFGVFSIVALTVLGAMVCIVYFQFRAKKLAELAPSENNRSDGTPDECWKWGFIYDNPNDPAFLVEKRIGYGWTLNMGNKWSWVFSAAILATPFVIRFLWFRN